MIKLKFIRRVQQQPLELLFSEVCLRRHKKLITTRTTNRNSTDSSVDFKSPMEKLGWLVFCPAPMRVRAEFWATQLSMIINIPGSLVEYLFGELNVNGSITRWPPFAYLATTTLTLHCVCSSTVAIVSCFLLFHRHAPTRGLRRILRHRTLNRA